MANNLIIVESPAKVKTISKFLGKSYTIDATMGHLIDMPKSSLGVDVENDYEPKYITIRGKGELLSKLKKEAKKADKIYGELINLMPNNGEIYAEFADFLANSNRLDLAEQNYDKALNLGVKRANLGLALVKLAKMDQKGALPYLEEYLKSYADDEFAKMLASSIKEGTLKVEP